MQHCCITFKMGLDDLLKNVQTVAVFCNQYGDTGKGKFSDYFASAWADVTARGTGGDNAGHTVKVNGKKKVFHIIPAGISEDKNGKVTILGNGMVVNPENLVRELVELEREEGTYNHLMLSKGASVITPYHVIEDKAKNQSQKNGGIGTTGRGIGPCYSDKIARRGIFVEDLFDRDILSKKLNKLRERFNDKNLDIPSSDDVISYLMPFAEILRPLVRDTISEMHNFFRQGKKINIEGAQGTLLSVEYGVHPYVTSSDCSLNGTAAGVGLSAKMVDLPLGIIKFPFMTRVGGGPFVTEFGGRAQELYCAEEGRHSRKDELSEHGIPFRIEANEVIYDQRHPKIIEMINSSDQFVQGIGVRLAADEYGATTGRPRRTGWTDAVAARYSVGINGPLFILTKADAISDIDNFKLCFGYKDGDQEVSDFSKSESFQRRVTPVYKSYQGYGDISHVRSYSALPSSLRQSIGDFEQFSGGKVKIVSVGSDREETIVV